LVADGDDEGQSNAGATRKSARPSSRQLAGGRSTEGCRSAEHQERNVSRVQLSLPWVLGLLAAAPLAAAFGQNLDAGKSASQIFAEVCANCHRGPREFKSNPGASFLREHYTTGSEMASTMAAYLSGNADSRGAAQPKRQPQATPPGAAATRDAPPADPSSRDPRRAQQTPDPKDSKDSRIPRIPRLRRSPHRLGSARPRRERTPASPTLPPRPSRSSRRPRPDPCLRNSKNSGLGSRMGPEALQRLGQDHAAEQALRAVT
jgi:hypothetical protein